MSNNGFAKISKLYIESLTFDVAQLEDVINNNNVESPDTVIIPPEADVLTDNEVIDDDCTEDIEVGDVCGTLELHVAEKDGNKKVVRDTIEYKKVTSKKKRLCNSKPI